MARVPTWTELRLNATKLIHVQKECYESVHKLLDSEIPKLDRKLLILNGKTRMYEPCKPSTLPPRTLNFQEPTLSTRKVSNHSQPQRSTQKTLDRLQPPPLSSDTTDHWLQPPSHQRSSSPLQPPPATTMTTEHWQPPPSISMEIDDWQLPPSPPLTQKSPAPNHQPQLLTRTTSDQFQPTQMPVQTNNQGLQPPKLSRKVSDYSNPPTLSRKATSNRSQTPLLTKKTSDHSLPPSSSLKSLEHLQPPPLPLSEYLRRNRPELINRVERRAMYLRKRAERRKYISSTRIINSLEQVRLSSNRVKPPRQRPLSCNNTAPTYQVKCKLSEKEMKMLTARTYNRLPEVKRRRKEEETSHMKVQNYKNKLEYGRKLTENRRNGIIDYPLRSSYDDRSITSSQSDFSMNDYGRAADTFKPDPYY